MQGDYETARAYLERSLRISRETGHRTSELYSLINLSAYSEILGEYEKAISYAEQALSIAREIVDRPGEAWALTYLGHGLQSLKRYSDAQSAYQGALELQNAMNQPALATEPGAGLARVALELGDLSAAQDHVDTILVHLDGGSSLDGTDEPLRVYLSCYLVLKAVKNERAASILETAHKILLERANKIKNESLRHTFLENVPYHREILVAWEAEQRNHG
jgi:tetratricopeptide (TPR) repeat protein